MIEYSLSLAKNKQSVSELDRGHYITNPNNALF